MPWHAQDKSVMRARLTELGCRARDGGGDGPDGVAGVRRRGGLADRPEDIERWVRRQGRAGRCAAADAADWLTGGGALLAEERVAFTRELAVLVARSPHGQAAV